MNFLFIGEKSKHRDANSYETVQDDDAVAVLRVPPRPAVQVR